MIKLDKKDLKIMHELDLNAQISNKKLAKKVALSEQAVGYRINSLIKKGVIKNFILNIDPSTLGYTHYKMFLKLQNLSTEREAELINFLVKSRNTTWVISLRGNFDMVVSVWAKDIYEFQEFYQSLKNKYGKNISDEDIVTITEAVVFNRSYFLQKEKIEFPYGGKKELTKIDALDSKILSVLSNKARLTFIEVGKILKTKPDTIRYRIKKLKKLGIITGPRISLNYKNIGRRYMLLLLQLQNFNQETLKKFELFSKGFDSILYFITTIGSHNAEIEAEIVDNEEFDKLLKSFRDTFFVNIKSYTSLEITEEHKLNFYPF